MLFIVTAFTNLLVAEFDNGKKVTLAQGKNWRMHELFRPLFLEMGTDIGYNTPRFSDRHNYGGMTRNRYICKKEENQNGKTI